MPFLSALTTPIRIGAAAGVAVAAGNELASTTANVEAAARTVTGAGSSLLGGAAQSSGELARAVAGAVGEAVGAPPARRLSRQGEHYWIEVRGLDRQFTALAAELRARLEPIAGVTAVHVNGPLSRVLVTVAPIGQHHPRRQRLVDAVTAAEEAVRSLDPQVGIARRDPIPLPGDDAPLAAGLAGAGLGAAGVAASAVTALAPGLRLSRVVSAPIAVLDYHPALRARLAGTLGEPGSELLIRTLASAAAGLTGAPAAALVNTALSAVGTAEALAGRRGWERTAPELADRARTGGDVPVPPGGLDRPAPPAASRYERLSVNTGLIGAGLVGLTGTAAQGADAAVVGTPKAVRTVGETFATVFGSRLAERHAALILRPSALRRLAGIDTLLVEPRALFTTELRVSRVSGIAPEDRSVVWQAAGEALAAGRLSVGWNTLTSGPGRGGRVRAVLDSVRPACRTGLLGLVALRQLPHGFGGCDPGDVAGQHIPVDLQLLVTGPHLLRESPGVVLGQFPVPRARQQILDPRVDGGGAVELVEDPQLGAGGFDGGRHFGEGLHPADQFTPHRAQCLLTPVDLLGEGRIEAAGGANPVQVHSQPAQGRDVGGGVGQLAVQIHLGALHLEEVRSPGAVADDAVVEVPGQEGQSLVPVEEGLAALGGTARRRCAERLIGPFLHTPGSAPTGHLAHQGGHPVDRRRTGPTRRAARRQIGDRSGQQRGEEPFAIVDVEIEVLPALPADAPGAGGEDALAAHHGPAGVLAPAVHAAQPSAQHRGHHAGQVVAAELVLDVQNRVLEPAQVRVAVREPGQRVAGGEPPDDQGAACRIEAAGGDEQAGVVGQVGRIAGDPRLPRPAPEIVGGDRGVRRAHGPILRAPATADSQVSGRPAAAGAPC